MWQKKEKERIKERKERGEGEWWRGVGMGREIEEGLKENAVKEKSVGGWWWWWWGAGGKKEREKERRKKGGWWSVKIKKKSPSAREKRRGGGGGVQNEGEEEVEEGGGSVCGGVRAKGMERGKEIERRRE